jgi:hypothetical protein
LQIEVYFQAIVSTCSEMKSSSLNFDKRSRHEGFIKGEIKFIDDSTLSIREFVSVETGIERDTYAYQYMDAQNTLIFRYDNTPHHKKLNLLTYPHHKHDGIETNVIASSAPTLAEVLQEITATII